MATQKKIYRTKITGIRHEQAKAAVLNMVKKHNAKVLATSRHTVTVQWPDLETAEKAETWLLNCGFGGVDF